jgi:hypothetical protein
VKGEWKPIVQEVTHLFGGMGLAEVNPVAENLKTVEAKKEIPKETANDQNWELVSEEEKKNNIVRLTEKEWKSVKKAREKNGKSVTKSWFFKEESNALTVTEEEWKVIQEVREKNKKRGWFF